MVVTFIIIVDFVSSLSFLEGSELITLYMQSASATRTGFLPVWSFESTVFLVFFTINAWAVMTIKTVLCKLSFPLPTREQMSPFYFKFQFRNVEYSSGRHKTLLCFRVDTPGGSTEPLNGYMEDEHATAHAEEAFFQQVTCFSYISGCIQNKTILFAMVYLVQTFSLYAHNCLLFPGSP